MSAALPDLAARVLGGGVVAASDGLLAAWTNLVRPDPPQFSAERMGPRGAVYDGWETRRRREPGHEWVIVRLGAAGIVRGVTIDTAGSEYSYPPEASVEATAVDGYPSPADIAAAEWATIVTRESLAGDMENSFPVTQPDRLVRYTHVRLSIYPDGAVARMRVHGEPVPDPRLLPRTLDLAALEHGGTVVSSSDSYSSSPANLILPGRAQTADEGWESARHHNNNAYVEFRLAAPARIHLAELDTSYFVNNAPGWASLTGRDARSVTSGAPVELLPKTRLQPDTLHRFLLHSETEVSHVRMNLYSGGGLARVRLRGELSIGGRDQLKLRWFNTLPVEHAARVLVAAGHDTAEANKTARSRPLASTRGLLVP